MSLSVHCLILVGGRLAKTKVFEAVLRKILFTGDCALAAQLPRGHPVHDRQLCTYSSL